MTDASKYLVVYTNPEMMNKLAKATILTNLTLAEYIRRAVDKALDDTLANL